MKKRAAYAKSVSARMLLASLLSLVVLLGVGACSAGGSGDGVSGGSGHVASTPTATDSADSSTNTGTVAQTPESDTGEDASLSSFTAEQRNAYLEGKDYLELMAFSRQELIDQLASEYGGQYPQDVAEFAVDMLEQNGVADWNAEALESARSYLDNMAFSRQGLIDQLTSEYGEQFTQEQAEYAVSTLEEAGEVDWYEEAVESAQSYLDTMTFSRQGLIDQLTSEYGEQFTQDQAEYAAEQVFD